MFVEKGFAATKLDDVAVAAGISKGLLYRYFDNKAELFKEVIRQTLVTTIRDVGDRARASDNAVAALDIFLEQMIAVAKDARRSAIPKLVISEFGSFPELAVFYLAEVIGPGLQQLQAWSAAASRAESSARSIPELAAKSIIAPLLLSVIWRHTFARYDSESLRSRCADPAASRHSSARPGGARSGATERRKRRSS